MIYMLNVMQSLLGKTKWRKLNLKGIKKNIAEQREIEMETQEDAAFTSKTNYSENDANEDRLF